MKFDVSRAALAKLIQQYFQQLTVGCSQTDCSNTYCASSPQFSYDKPLKGSEAAAEALKLIKLKAPLCHQIQASVKRLPEDEGGNDVRTSSSSEVKDADSGADSTWHQVAKKGNTSKSESQASSSAHVNHGENAMVFTATAIRARYQSTTNSKGLEVTDDWLKCGLWKENLVDTCTACHAAGNWSKLIRLIGATFRDCDRLVGNFLPKEAISSMEADADKDVDEFAMSTDSISESEIQPATSSKDALLAVDISRVHNSFDYLFGIDKHFSLPELPFTSALATAVEAMAASMPKRLVSNMASYANALVVLMELPISAILELSDRVVPCLCLIAERLPVDMQARLATLWSKCDATRLHDMVHPIQQYVTMQVITNSWSHDVLVNDDPNITAAIKLLKILYYASILGGRVTAPEVREMEQKLATADPKTPAEMLLDILQRMDGASASGSDREELMKREDDPLERQLGITRLDCREPLIPLDDFINEPLSDVIEMDKDYLYYRMEAADNKFTFMLHPFMLTTLTKNLAMYFDNRIRMLQERRQSFIQTFIGGQISLPHLRLHIRRDHIIDDALVALEMAALENPDDLKKQLFVEFEGEQGIDEGGLSKEFFQLVIEELFNPDYGMFIWSEETKTFWFNATSFENDSQFSLVGILLGLAIYNNIILDIRFPMVVYRKLLGKLGTFDDLQLSHPTLARGLKQMLEYPGDDFEEVFEQTFAISYQDVFGNTLTHDLKPGGADTPVTKQNRQEFVDMYADFLLNTSVASQFQAFRRGFCLVTDESPLRLLFMPEEVEQLVCGSRHFDFHALEAGTTYDGGFDENSPTVRHFWDVVHNSFNDEQRRKLLEFVTGSDRAPLGGLAKLRLVITRHGPDCDRLPTAHTCFNVLLLPDYGNRDKLHDLLLKAINYAKGFGML